MAREYKIFSIALLVFALLVSFAFGKQQQQGYILEHEKDIAKEQAGPHDGKGLTTGHSFFSKASELKIAFRKRVLKVGSSIGYHLQQDDEIFYIISGKGVMEMNGKNFPVKAGDAILTRPGNWHGLQQTGEEELAIIINYLVK
jgi:mannose-6-phosphate isomerase-like protein (cupin superfamily)